MRFTTMFRAFFRKMPAHPPKQTEAPEKQPSFLEAREEMVSLCKENIEHSQEIRAIVKRKKSGLTVEVPPVTNRK